MKSIYLHIALLLFCSIPLWSQEDGVVSYNLPARNSMTFNKFLLSPTFSVVREYNQTISFTNKREWVQFNDSPSSFIFSYSGRLNDKSGFGAALYQQNFGVLTTYGGVLNYASFNGGIAYNFLVWKSQERWSTTKVRHAMSRFM